MYKYYSKLGCLHGINSGHVLVTTRLNDDLIAPF
jgi:hypothetical protein